MRESTLEKASFGPFFTPDGKGFALGERGTLLRWVG